MAAEDDVPDWLKPGGLVTHATFGTGTVVHVGEYKGVPTVWVDFDYGERKALALEFALPHLSSRKRWARRTPTRPDLRCDVCGQQPLVMNTHGQMLCDDHRAQFRT